MTTTIRKAVAADCPRMMELVVELAVYEKEPDAVTVSMEHFVNSGFGPNPVWDAFVVEANGVVQGFALWYVRYSTWKGQRLYLEDLIVTKAMRGQSLGRQLFDALIVYAQEKKYSGIVWQVLDWNEPAINFYKKLGDVSFNAGWLNCSLDLT